MGDINITSIPEAEQRYCAGGSLEFEEITADKGKCKLMKLKPNSALGPDRLWQNPLQKLADVIALPFSVIYTKCLVEVTVPPDWKAENVTPIFRNTGDLQASVIDLSSL